MEMPVHIDGEEAERYLSMLHQHRYGRRHEIRAVGADDEIDLVDVDELRIDAGHVRRIALVVIEDELDRPPHHAALGIDVVAPDLQAEQKLLAVGRRAAGEVVAEADADRVRRARRQGKRQQDQSGERGMGEAQQGSSPQLGSAARTGLASVPTASAVAVTMSPGFMKIFGLRP
jgi:hypothetical protein